MLTKLLPAVGIWCLLTVFVVACSNESDSEGKEDKIARAMSAGPAQISKEAKIIDYDGTVLREGSNGWVCMPSMSANDKVPMCNDATWMALLHALMKQQPFKADKVGYSYMLAGDIPTNNDDPYDTTRDEGEPWVQEGPHIMIVFPDRASLEGWPDDPNAGGPYVMWKNTPYAHVMVPIAAR